MAAALVRKQFSLLYIRIDIYYKAQIYARSPTRASLADRPFRSGGSPDVWGGRLATPDCANGFQQTVSWNCDGDLSNDIHQRRSVWCTVFGSGGSSGKRERAVPAENKVKEPGVHAESA